MIIRIYRGTVFPGKEHAWQNRVEQLSIPWLKSQPGLIAFYPGKPMRASGGRTFCMVMVWDSVDSIAAAVGEDWKIPNYLGDEAELIEKSELDHFELYP
jgi:heme-degrading monooxygenase HmoA